MSLQVGKIPGLADKGEVLLGAFHFSPKNVFLLPSKIEWRDVSLSVQAFVNSGTVADFLDFDLAQSLGIEPVPLEEPIGICTLDGTPLKGSSARFRTPGLRLSVGAPHCETISFL